MLPAAAQIAQNPNKPPFELRTPVNVPYSFSAATNYVPFLGYTNADGAFCTASLVQGSDGRLYGVAPSGGDFGSGTVFSLNIDGNGFAVLHTFSALNGRLLITNEGANPTGLLLGIDGRLYGTTSKGGTNGFGVVFGLNVDGTGFTNLHNFAESDGKNPQGGLVQGPDGTLYGTAQNGGANGSGTVFSLGADGANFTVLYDFTALSNGTNADGMNPYGGLIVSADGTLYGTARYGGPSGSVRGFSPSIGSGTIFSLKTNGAAFTVLHSFDWFGGDFLSPTNRDGASPVGNLLLDSDGKFLYGTAPEAGAGSSGTIFRLGTDGKFTVLQTFDRSPPAPGHSPGYGLYPYGGVVQGNDGMLYGACYGGGYFPDGGYFAGTLYRLNPDGTGLALLHSFDGMDPISETNIDGANPWATLLKANDGKLYGLTSAGGPNGSGTVFSFAPPVVLQINVTNGLVALNWPASATNFVLETSPTIVSGAAWTPLTNGITMVTNNLSLTLPASGGPAFFRLHAKP
jgi:uncharacterized repeat protein (TIGR03803 family)